MTLIKQANGQQIGDKITKNSFFTNLTGRNLRLNVKEYFGVWYSILTEKDGLNLLLSITVLHLLCLVNLKP